MSHTVLFAGGPLHGTTMTTDSTHGVYAMDYGPETTADLLLGRNTPREPVLYHLSRLAICGRLIWIGHLTPKPDDDLVFDVLTSDAAKAASTVPGQAQPAVTP